MTFMMFDDCGFVERLIPFALRGYFDIERKGFD